jgi:outer membrane protein
MIRSGSFWIVATAFSLAGLAGPAGAQETSEARIQELVRQAAERVATGQPVTAQAPAIQAAAASETRPTVRLSLDEAVKLALDRNLDIAVQRLNPQINDIAIASIRSIYHPSLTSTVLTQSQTNPATNTIAGANVAGAGVVNDNANYNAGIAQSIPWGGGNLAIQFNNSRVTTTSLNNLYNPSYTSFWTGQYTQPLLRGFRTDSTRQQLAVTSINREISDVQLRASITNTLSNVRNAYWDYVTAVQAVEVARQSLDLADNLVRDNQTRVQVGTMAPIDVVQAQSEAATRRQALVAAESARRTTELALKRLIVDGTQDPNWNATLEPIDRPEFRPEPIDLEAAIRRALSERTDIDIAKKNVQANNVTLRYLRDQTLPQADLLAFYGLQGLGGTQLITAGSGVNRDVIDRIPGGYGNALSSLFGSNYPRWTMQLNFSYPLGTSSQEASVARARVQLSQVEAQMKQIELQIANDVTNAVIEVQNAAEAVQAGQAARELAQRRLEAEQSKFEVGMSTNYFVVQAQRDLLDSQTSELRAVLDYRKALVELDRVQQTTIQSSNITLLSTGGATGGTTGSGGANNTGVAGAGGGGAFGGGGNFGGGGGNFGGGGGGFGR